MKQNHLSNQEFSELFQSLAVMLHAGMDLGSGLDLLIEDSREGTVRTVLAELREQIDTGIPLSEAGKNADCFSGYALGLLTTGERTGRLEETLTSLARYYERKDDLYWRIRSALTYPTILVVLLLTVVILLLAKVLPIFEGVYASLGGEVTGIAAGLLAFGKVLNTLLPVICIVAAVVLVLGVACTINAGIREKLKAAWKKRWGDRGVARKIGNARMAQALSMGIQSGIQFEEALELAADVMQDTPAAAKRCRDCAEKLYSGEDLSKALRDTEVLPAASCRLLEVGMRSGSGDAAMEQIVSSLSEEADRALESKVSRIEPLLVLITSLVVGVILLAVMLPLMNIMAAIG